MKINLAGYNVDTAHINNAIALGLEPDALTPETLCAAYARISRDPAPVDELRATARRNVAKARASNENIVFGMGHYTIAEHATFNFDLLEVSRLAIEAIEHGRLNAYTERSQRYQKLQDDYVVPQEIREVGGKLEKEFRELVDFQNETYHTLYELLLAWYQSQPKGSLVVGTKNTVYTDKTPAKLLEGRAKEDARYVTSLAMEGQLGMTINARDLEHMVRRLASHPLEEARAVGSLLHESVKHVASSLVKRIEPYAMLTEGVSDLKAFCNKIVKSDSSTTSSNSLVNFTRNPDVTVLATLLYTITGKPMETCLADVKGLEEDQKVLLVRSLFQHMEPWTAAPRALEVISFTFDLLVSASCFAQLKRHRMMTLLPKAYDVHLGCVVPPSVVEANLIDPFMKAVTSSSEFYKVIEEKTGSPEVAAYILTQSHQRRVLVSLNAREAYHIARLRLDGHAQWDIRKVVRLMFEELRKKAPLTFLMACGKDDFNRYRSELLEVVRWQVT